MTLSEKIVAQICTHLLEDRGKDIYFFFTGDGVFYRLLCEDCKKTPDNLMLPLQSATQAQVDELDDFYWEYLGEPGIITHELELALSHRTIGIKPPLKSAVRKIIPMNRTQTSQWLAILSSGEIIQLDLATGHVFTLAQIAPSKEFIFDEQTSLCLHLSLDNHYAVVGDDTGAHGVVIDLYSGRITMVLDRGSYRTKHTPLPVAFFEHEGKPYLIHGTDWNRLDISNPSTGKLITKRAYETVEKGQQPAHYLNYFHSLPVISPDSEWVAEDGWVWHPIGITHVWNVRRWLSENVWESEDGPSLRRLNQRDYYWNGPLCWIDSHRLAVWGLITWNDNPLPAIQIYEASTGTPLNLIGGPKEGPMYFDRYLFSVPNDKTGLSAWDVDSGARVFHADKFNPIAYHPGMHEFLTMLHDGVFQLTRIIDLTGHEPN